MYYNILKYRKVRENKIIYTICYLWYIKLYILKVFEEFNRECEGWSASFEYVKLFQEKTEIMSIYHIDITSYPIIIYMIIQLCLLLFIHFV